MICYYFLFQRLLKSSKSKRLEKQSIEVKGPLRSINQWIDMSNRNVTLQNGTQVKTCSPALGYSFAAGTMDGSGVSGFTQGARSSSYPWSLITSFISNPSVEHESCHAPKPILLDTGNVIILNNKKITVGCDYQEFH